MSKSLQKLSRNSPPPPPFSRQLTQVEERQRDRVGYPGPVRCGEEEVEASSKNGT
jgi:hypothetical protein